MHNLTDIFHTATEKMKTDVSFIIEHVIGQSGEDTFPQSKSMLAGLGATLIKRSDVGYAIGPRTLVFKSHHDGNIAEKAEVILSFAPAILISQRIEYLLDEEVSSKSLRWSCFHYNTSCMLIVFHNRTSHDHIHQARQQQTLQRQRTSPQVLENSPFSTCA